MWFGCLPLSDEQCHFSSYFVKDEATGRGIGQRACKVKGCQANVSSHLPSLFFILCAFFIFRLCLSSSFLPTSSPSFLFYFGIWRHHRPLLAGTVSQSIQGIYQLLLNLLSSCQIPHHSCAHKHTHMYTYTHTHHTWQSEASTFLTEDRHIKEEQKNTFLIRS